LKTGSKKKHGSGAFLLFKDSNWKSNAGVVRTCLSIDELAAHVKAIPVRQRLIVLDVVHMEYPRDDSYFKVQKLRFIN
jgi:hypothetical protein